MYFWGLTPLFYALRSIWYSHGSGMKYGNARTATRVRRRSQPGDPRGLPRDSVVRSDASRSETVGSSQCATFSVTLASVVGLDSITVLSSPKMREGFREQKAKIRYWVGLFVIPTHAREVAA